LNHDLYDFQCIVKPDRSVKLLSYLGSVKEIQMTINYRSITLLGNQFLLLFAQEIIWLRSFDVFILR